MNKKNIVAAILIIISIVSSFLVYYFQDSVDNKLISLFFLIIFGVTLIANYYLYKKK